MEQVMSEVLIGFALNENVNKVYSTEINKDNFDILKHNIWIDKLNNKISIKNDDFIQYIKHISKGFCDLVFIDPPWGGPRYKFIEN